MTPAAPPGPPRVKAAGRLLATFLVSAAAGFLLALILQLLLHVRPETVLRASTVGVRNVALPLIKAGGEARIDPSLVIFALNSLASLILASVLFMCRLADPDRTSLFPSLARRFMIKDPTIYVLYPMPGFRAIGDRRLRPAFAWLSATPVLVFVVLGAIIGALVAAAPFHETRLGSIAVALACLAPHGIFEIPALALAGSLPLAAYYHARADLESGAGSAAFDKIRGLATWRESWRTLAGVGALLAVAALLEAHVTERAAVWIRGLLP